MIQYLLPLIKYWKAGTIALLVFISVTAVYMARSRGERLAATEKALTNERQNFQTQINNIEKARQDEKERNSFRKIQNKKLRFADDDTLRDVYDGLRERQAGHIAR